VALKAAPFTDVIVSDEFKTNTDRSVQLEIIPLPHREAKVVVKNRRKDWLWR
jgi:hypothetical protein